jgi:tetratricopeptide (TPR) repeat protein
MDADPREERNAFLEQTEALLKGEDWQSALVAALARLGRLPGDPDARMVLCRVRIRQGRLDEARELLGGLEGFLSGLAASHAAMGDACLERGMAEEAAAHYRKSLALDPAAAPAADAAGKLRAAEERRGMETRAEAEEEAEAPAEVPPDFRTVTLAELYVRQGHLGAAEELLEEILRGEPDGKRAAGLLREVREKIRGEALAKRNRRAIAELSRWLGNIGRLSGHAA